ncbi:MAG TPA: M20/M25/M40 family metallo-hydrolase [Planctomycetota bacterium]|jgi:acetylornithine deacetylase/succinyl-diaminopimelate desuccinylase-like protein
MYTILKAKTDGLKDEAFSFAQELVQTPSPSGQEGRVAQTVASRMRALRYDLVVEDDFGNVLGLLRGEKDGPKVLLSTHLDTIKAGAGWSDDPFSGRVANGLLHGLGAGDCKAGIAAHVYAGALLKRSLLPLAGDLLVAATVGEENSYSVGIRGLLQKTLNELEMKPAYAILGEPTDLGLYYGHDGWFEADVVIEGTNPFMVEDAAKAVFRELDASRQKEVEELLVAEPQSENAQELRRSRIGVSRRLHASEEIGAVLKQLHRHAALVTQTVGAVVVDVQVRENPQRLYNGKDIVVRHITHAWDTGPFDPLMERARHALEAASCEVRPGKWRLGRMGMGTAGGVLRNEFQIPTIGYGPGNEELVHAPNESVELSKLATCIYGTASIVHSLIGIPLFGWTTDDI